MQNSAPKAKHAMIDKYVLVKTIGTGYNSKVKLAYDHASEQYSAIKMIKYSHPAIKPQYIVREVEILTTLNHPNVVGIKAFLKAADYTKKNGETYKVVAIVMELLSGGELFEYLASSGRFTEEVSRLFFRIILETLHYCHKQGITHRDLKPDNLLFDSGFNLKITDFGFATMLAGKEGNQLQTILGTESYMAPELHAGQSYSGEAVDLFACGIILFFMMNGRPPFTKADPKVDPVYKLIAIGKNEIFWENHEKNKQKKEGQETFFSADFRDLINSMLAVDPNNRLTLEQVKAHKWVQGPLVDSNKLFSEFKFRKKLVDARLDKQREAKKQQKLKANTQGHPAENVFTGIQPFRSLESVELEICERIEKEFGEQIDFKAKREIGEYQPEAGFKVYTEVLTVLDADIVFKVLCLASKNKLAHYSVDEKTYKIKGKGVKDEGSCTLNIILSKVDEDTTCIEFHKTSGNVLIFYESVEDIKNCLPSLQLEDETENQENQENSEVKAQ